LVLSTVLGRSAVRRTGKGDAPDFSVRRWRGCALCLRSGERCRLYQLIGRRCAVDPLQLLSPSPRSRKVLERQQSRGRVAEWLKAPDSKLFLPLWTDFLPLGQKCHFRPISLGFYNSHLDMEGHRKTRFPTSSIQVEYTSGSIQVGVYKSEVSSRTQVASGCRRKSTFFEVAWRSPGQSGEITHLFTGFRRVKADYVFRRTFRTWVGCHVVRPVRVEIPRRVRQWAID